MRILVLSMLRIGDIILAAPALRGLRDRYPQAQLHLLINSQFKQVGSLLPYVNKVILFEREKLQTGLGSPDVPVFDSYERLNDFVAELDAEEYDCIVNLTHNRLSGWLMGGLRSKEKIGLCFDAHARADFGSSWFRYLNSQVDAEGYDVFHFADVFRFALGLGDSVLHKQALYETDTGRSEVDAFFRSTFGSEISSGERTGEVRGHELIAVQALTSDIKKDWGFAQFAAAMLQIQRVRPNVCFLIFGAPFERERLESLMVRLVDLGVQAKLAILSFEGAFTLVKRSQLLLTLDTSIKHLACMARTPVVEIALGSSDVQRTGAYSDGSVIIKSRETCAPCVHSKPCHRQSQACAEGISPDAVAMVVCETMERRTFQLRAIASEFKSEIEILRVGLSAPAFWTAHSVLEDFSEANVGRWIDMACRKVWIDGAHAQVGSEIRSLGRLLKTIHPTASEVEWRHLLDDFERQAASIEGRVNSFKVGMQYLRGCYEDPRKMKEFVRSLISFRERVRHAPLLRSFKQSLDQVIEDDISPAFTRFRRFNDLVFEIEQRTQIHLRIIRGLSIDFSETTDFEKGIENP